MGNEGSAPSCEPRLKAALVWCRTCGNTGQDLEFGAVCICEHGRVLAQALDGNRPMPLKAWNKEAMPSLKLHAVKPFSDARPEYPLDHQREVNLAPPALQGVDPSQQCSEGSLTESEPEDAAEPISSFILGPPGSATPSASSASASSAQQAPAIQVDCPLPSSTEPAKVSRALHPEAWGGSMMNKQIACLSEERSLLSYTLARRDSEIKRLKLRLDDNECTEASSSSTLPVAGAQRFKPDAMTAGRISVAENQAKAYAAQVEELQALLKQQQRQAEEYLARASAAAELEAANAACRDEGFTVKRICELELDLKRHQELADTTASENARSKASVAILEAKLAFLPAANEQVQDSNGAADAENKRLVKDNKAICLQVSELERELRQQQDEQKTAASRILALEGLLQQRGEAERTLQQQAGAANTAREIHRKDMARAQIAELELESKQRQDAQETATARIAVLEGLLQERSIAVADEISNAADASVARVSEFERLLREQTNAANAAKAKLDKDIEVAHVQVTELELELKHSGSAHSAVAGRVLALEGLLHQQTRAVGDAVAVADSESARAREAEKLLADLELRIQEEKEVRRRNVKQVAELEGMLEQQTQQAAEAAIAAECEAAQQAHDSQARFSDLEALLERREVDCDAAIHANASAPRIAQLELTVARLNHEACDLRTVHQRQLDEQAQEAQARFSDLQAVLQQQQAYTQEAINAKDRAAAQLEAALEMQSREVADESAKQAQEAQARFSLLQSALDLQQRDAEQALAEKNEALSRVSERDRLLREHLDAASEARHKADKVAADAQARAESFDAELAQRQDAYDRAEACASEAAAQVAELESMLKKKGESFAAVQGKAAEESEARIKAEEDTRAAETKVLMLEAKLTQQQHDAHDDFAARLSEATIRVAELEAMLQLKDASCGSLEARAAEESEARADAERNARDAQTKTTMLETNFKYLKDAHDKAGAQSSARTAELESMIESYNASFLALEAKASRASEDRIKAHADAESAQSKVATLETKLRKLEVTNGDESEAEGEVALLEAKLKQQDARISLFEATSGKVTLRHQQDAQDIVAAEAVARAAELEALLQHKTDSYAELEASKNSMQKAAQEFQHHIASLKAHLNHQQQVADAVLEEKAIALSRASELEIQLQIHLKATSETKSRGEGTSDVEELQSRLWQQMKRGDVAVDEALQSTLRSAKLEELLYHRAQELAIAKATSEKEALASTRKVADLEATLQERKAASEDQMIEMRSTEMNADLKAQAQIDELQRRLKQQGDRAAAAAKEECAALRSQVRSLQEELGKKEGQLRHDDTRRLPEDISAPRGQSNGTRTFSPVRDSTRRVSPTRGTSPLREESKVPRTAELPSMSRSSELAAYSYSTPGNEEVANDAERLSADFEAREAMRSRLSRQSAYQELLGMTFGSTAPPPSYPAGTPPASCSFSVPELQGSARYPQQSSPALVPTMPGNSDFQTDWQSVTRQASVPNLSFQQSARRRGFNTSPRAEMQGSRSAASVVVPTERATSRAVAWRPGMSSPSSTSLLRPVLAQHQQQQSPGTLNPSAPRQCSPPPVTRPSGRTAPAPSWANASRLSPS